MSFLPLSIPSPPPEWETPITLPIGQWLHWLLPFVPEGQIIPIHTYALCILAGIVAATIMVNSRLTRRGAEPGVVIDVIIWAIPLGLVGARAYHVVTHPNDYFYAGADLMRTLYIWEGGVAIFGALIGGAIGAWIGCRAHGIRFWAFADALAPAMLVAQAFGRLGNYFNNELFGLPTNLPWGLEIPAPNAAIPIGLPPETLFHPTFLYEIIWNVIGVFLLLALERSHTLRKREILGITIPVLVGNPVARLQWGKVWALYLMWYGIGRSIFETIRVDPSEVFFGIRTNVWGAFAAIALGIVLLGVQSRRHPGVEPDVYVVGHKWATEGVVDSPDTYSDVDESGNDATEMSERDATSAARTPSP